MAAKAPLPGACSGRAWGHFISSLGEPLTHSHTNTHTLWCYGGPRGSSTENELKDYFQNSVSQSPGFAIFKTQVATRTPLSQDCFETAWGGASFRNSTNRLSRSWWRLGCRRGIALSKTEAKPHSTTRVNIHRRLATGPLSIAYIFKLSVSIRSYMS